MSAGLDRQTKAPLDAIDDLGSDAPPRVKGLTTSYARDPNVRRAVMRPSVTWSVTTFIALAKDGADRMTNVIALCADDHRKAYYSEQRSSIEQEMIDIVKAGEGRRASQSGPSTQATEDTPSA